MGNDQKRRNIENRESKCGRGAGIQETNLGPLFVMVLLENEGMVTMNTSWLIYNVLTASRRIGTRTDAGLIYLFVLNNRDALA